VGGRKIIRKKHDVRVENTLHEAQERWRALVNMLIKLQVA
jgi:hypothetical protein